MGVPTVKADWVSQEDYHPTCVNVYYTIYSSGKSAWAFEYIPEDGHNVIRAHSVPDARTCQKMAEKVHLDYGIRELTPEQYRIMVKDWPKWESR